MASESETVYCLCRQPYDETQFMIECDVCKDWFHGNCVGVQEHQASDIEIYHCPNCQLIHGPLVLKSRRNWHRHDYSEPDPTKAVQTGTVVFIKELKNRTFPSAEEIPLVKLHGNKLTPDYLEQNSFDVPILVEKKDGLGLRVPPPSFTIQDVENYVGSMREIDVIDVARQEDYKMLMREWTEYYNSPNREKIFNVISLEFSNTRLAEFITPPTIVRQVSWVVNMWPDQLPEDCPYSKPEVQKYCLMGVRDSFTDFHVDFGGTSVWYHVLRGEKVFYLIKPTSANLVLYESWISSSTQSETFFGDQVDFCYKCVVRQGQTLFIPTGWIHAVFTPIDTLVFGGNFLHNYNIPLQLQVFEIEKRVKTPEKYMFPSFETMCWHAAKHVLDILRESEEDKKKPKSYIVQGAKALACHLKSWTQRKDLNTNYLFVKTAKHNIPEHVQYGKLLKDLTKLARHFEMQLKVSPKPKVDRKRRKKNMPTPKQMQNLDILHQHTQEKLQEIQEEHKNVYIFQDDPPSPPAGLKVRIPKGGVLNTAKDEKTNQDKGDISTSLKLKVSNGRIVGDGAQPISQGKFQPLVGGEEEEDKDSDPDQLVVDETPQSKKKNSLKDRINSRSTMKPGSLKLKLSVHGKVKQETAELKQQEKLEVKQEKLEVKQEKAEVKQEKAGTKQEKTGTKQEKAETKQEKAGTKQEKVEAKQEKVEAKQEKAESKQEKAETKQEKTETKQEPEVAPNLGKSEVLKSRATTSKQQNTSNVSVHSKVKQEGSDSLDQEEVDISASAVEQSQRMNMPTIRGGLNCSIADILEASGYGTETDFQVDDEIGRAPSPSMRDAIQGMLSMSRMGGLQLFGGSAGPNSGNLRHSGYPRNFRPSNIDDEDFEQLNSCYKDEEYVYPSLDISDDEAQHIFKPRGKLKKDETWNPKARVQVSGEKREHMSRDSAKREAVESGLAAAAAKYASAPPSKPKKPNRKKLKTECIRSDPDPQPSTSSAHPTIAQAAGSLGAIHHISKALSSPSKPKKPKKGFATAKQRLGRILKIHKMRF